MPVITKPMTAAGSGKATPCIWNAASRKFSERCVPGICIPHQIFLMQCVFAAYGCIVICRCCRTQNRILRRWCRGLRKVTRWSPSNRTALWSTRKRFRQARFPLLICSWLAAVRILTSVSKRRTAL